jgi:hypothetical protein
MTVTGTRTGQIDVFVPQAMDLTALDAVIGLNVEAALARTGEWPGALERGRRSIGRILGGYGPTHEMPGSRSRDTFRRRAFPQVGA